MRDKSLLQHNSSLVWFFTLFYVVVLVLSNWFDPRLISIAGIDTDAGTLIFPLTFLLSDIITEVYGYKYARRAIWFGLLFNLLFIAYGQLIISLPSPNYAVNNAIFDQLFAASSRIIFASIISYLLAEPLNSLLMARLKIKLLGEKMWFRFIFSTLIAAGCDSFVFGFLAFYATMEMNDLVSLILNMWFLKVFIEFILLPLSISLVSKVKKIEKLDVYDTDTRFTVFSFDTNYKQESNKFSDNLILSS